MNDKLKQSLQERLSGMRWGEREQAEVFRQIQKKEMQEVKHVKRSVNMLAIAATMLFLLMGAAFALTGTGHPDDVTPLSQPTDNTFIPTPFARTETDFCIMTVTDAQWVGEELTIDMLLQLKEPEKYGLIISGYANPGAPNRRMLTAEFRGTCTIFKDAKRIACPISTIDVIDMTAESVAVRLTHPSIESELDTMDIRIDLEAHADYIDRAASLDFTILRAVQTSPQNHWLFDNELITAYWVNQQNTDDHAILTFDVVPRKPWYVINTEADGKTMLNVTANWSVGYDGATQLTGIKVDAAEFLPTDEGARCTVALPFPTEYQSLHFYGNIWAMDAVSGHSASGLINMTVNRPQAVKAPAPTPTPLLRSEPQGEHISGTEHVSVYLEDCWFDGYSGEGTLRIRADDPAECRLALKPNEQSMPDRNTWVVRIEDDVTYIERIDYTLTREEATGDVLMAFTYYDEHAHASSKQQSPDYLDYTQYQDFTLTITNELTWEEESALVKLTLTPSGEYAYHPLSLVSSNVPDTFVQAGYITTDRYHYVGVMRTFDNYYMPLILRDAQGNELGRSNGGFSSTAESLLIFPRALFPFNGGNDKQQYSFNIVRLDATTPLPETLQAECVRPPATNLPSFVLTTMPE